MERSAEDCRRSPVSDLDLAPVCEASSLPSSPFSPSPFSASRTDNSALPSSGSPAGRLGLWLLLLGLFDFFLPTVVSFGHIQSPGLDLTNSSSFARALIMRKRRGTGSERRAKRINLVRTRFRERGSTCKARTARRDAGAGHKRRSAL